MAIVVITTTPGMTKDVYDQALKKPGFAGGRPAGCTAHIAGESPNGWQVISVWDSQEALTKFQTEVLRPTMQEAGAPPPNAPVVYPLHNMA